MPRVLKQVRPAIVVLTALGISAPLNASPLARVTLDGMSRAQGIREWIEIAEPGNLGLLCMGIAGLMFGRWASRRKHGGPPNS
ncbi:hypothetical protein [Blastomonas sp. AAP53]|uniref:hypothetical protein n=1 Tax=Blastomonas sp. AAP53 TaxID=1248760 RepID=UPI001EE67DF4|nr:hypothetical protein [Blastomonas sp. AAP53]